MLARIVEKQRLEVWTTGRQNHLVRLDWVTVASQGHVHEGFALKELIEYIGEITLVIVPAQTELLRGTHAVLHDANSCLLACRLPPTHLAVSLLSNTTVLHHCSVASEQTTHICNANQSDIVTTAHHHHHHNQHQYQTLPQNKQSTLIKQPTVTQRRMSVRRTNARPEYVRRPKIIKSRQLSSECFLKKHKSTSDTRTTAGRTTITRNNEPTASLPSALLARSLTRSAGSRCTLPAPHTSSAMHKWLALYVIPQAKWSIFPCSTQHPTPFLFLPRTSSRTPPSYIIYLYKMYM